MEIHYQEEPASEAIATLINGVTQQALETKGLSAIKSYGFFINDAQAKIVGGIIGNTYYGCLYIDTLWVSDSLRNQGWGSKLMLEAEKLGKQRHCLFASLTTMDWEALAFYQKLNYEIEYIREGFEKNSKMYVLRKKL